MFFLEIETFTDVRMDDGIPYWEATGSSKKFLLRVAKILKIFLREAIKDVFKVNLKLSIVDLYRTTKEPCVRLAIAAEDDQNMGDGVLLNDIDLFWEYFEEILNEVSNIFVQMDSMDKNLPHKIKAKHWNISKKESDTIYSKDPNPVELANKIREVTARYPTPINVRCGRGAWTCLDVTNVATIPVVQVKEEPDNLLGLITCIDTKNLKGMLSNLKLEDLNETEISWPDDDLMTEELRLLNGSNEEVFLRGNFEQKWLAGSVVYIRFHILRIWPPPSNE